MQHQQIHTFCQALRLIAAACLCLLHACTDDRPTAGQRLAAQANTDFVALQCDWTDYVVIDTVPMFGWPDYYGYLNVPPVGNTKIYFKDFTFEIEDQFMIDDTIAGDTIYLYEDVGKYVIGKRIRLRPKAKDGKISLYMHVQELIQEQYDWGKLWAANEAKWTAKVNSLQTWRGESRVIVQDSLGEYYRLPNLDQYFELRRERRFALRDTMVHYSFGEGDGSSSAFVYRDKVSCYSISDALLEIVVQHGDGCLKTYWLKIIFSYGC